MYGLGSLEVWVENWESHRHAGAIMKRRTFLGIVVYSVLGSVAIAAPKRKKYVFKIRTEKGSIIGNIVIEGTSQSNAESKLRRRYPNCEILDCQEKD